MNNQTENIILLDRSHYCRHFVGLCRQFTLFRDRIEAFCFGFSASDNELSPLEMTALQDGRSGGLFAFVYYPVVGKSM